MKILLKGNQEQKEKYINKLIKKENIKKSDILKVEINKNNIEKYKNFIESQSFFDTKKVLIINKSDLKIDFKTNNIIILMNQEYNYNQDDWNIVKLKSRVSINNFFNNQEEQKEIIEFINKNDINHNELEKINFIKNKITKKELLELIYIKKETEYYELLNYLIFDKKKYYKLVIKNNFNFVSFSKIAQNIITNKNDYIKNNKIKDIYLNLISLENKVILNKINPKLNIFLFL